MDGVHVVLHGVDDDQHVSELGGDDSSPVVSGMFRPNNVDLVVPQVSELEGSEEQTGGINNRIKWNKHLTFFFLPAQTKSMPTTHTRSHTTDCIHHKLKAFDFECVRAVGGPGGDGVSV